MASHIERRKFLATLGGAAAAWPLGARAQQTKVYRIGALLVGNADVNSFRTELREELRRYDYVEGQNLIFEFQQGHGGPRS
jgi:putative ABC transport system substrate-binding protein